MSYLEDTFKHEQLKHLERYLPAAAIISVNMTPDYTEDHLISETVRIAIKLQKEALKAINAPS
jgi:hypothetical protein